MCAGEQISLDGWDCYDAVLFCASICAGQRVAKALNLGTPDGLQQPAHAVLATPALSADAHHVDVDDLEEDPPGCWTALKTTVSSYW